jgi:hypothetical protein
VDAVAFKESQRRAFDGRFPQLQLGASIWLPFKRNLMIEEPNWYGLIARYGSALRPCEVAALVPGQLFTQLITVLVSDALASCRDARDCR